jgi:hypothetical protein
MNTEQQVGHAYRVIPAFGGTVLKYEGIATAGNRSHLVDQGCEIRATCVADRIYVDGRPYDGARG